MDFKKMTAEFVGTTILVFCGVGAAVFEGKTVGVLGVAFAFGLILMALTYALGPVSDAHLNPAVSLGYVLSGRMKVELAAQYWVAQFLGGILGAALVVVVRAQSSGMDQKMFGADGWGSLSQTKASVGAAFIVEILATFLFVLVVLAVTSKVGRNGFQGIASGAALSVGYIIAIPVSGGGLNPARSLGPAIFAGGDALSQLWLYIVAPLLGSLLAVVVHALVSTETREEGEEPVVQPVRRRT